MSGSFTSLCCNQSLSNYQTSNLERSSVPSNDRVAFDLFMNHLIYFIRFTDLVRTIEKATANPGPIPDNQVLFRCTADSMPELARVRYTGVDIDQELNVLYVV